MPSPFLTAEWRKLLMVQYVVDPKLLQPYLPNGVELDLFHHEGEDRCYVSLVGFLFQKVRVKGLAIPLHTSFEEINLRFYVRRREADGTQRRGVVFIREFVPRRAIAFVARRLYEEPYVALPTRHHIALEGPSVSVQYDWKLGARWHTLAATVSSEPVPIAAASEEEFITEHYWGYTKRSDGSTSAYQVQHPRWQIYPVQSHTVDVDFGLLYGTRLAALKTQPIASALLAEGSAVSVFSGFGLPA